MVLGARHGIVGGGARHHQAGGGKNAVAMGALNRFIDFDGCAEVVGGDDELLQSTRRPEAGSKIEAQQFGSTQIR